eukprot:CAMPEP_0194759840 /NCGR_PEP_ID=MMETSP0323_2-20130528/12834_1 /TAXON_ID=2866 ORGANISM="Crypthecodinium cohnii, Strain Seligo" /NCGR_SAMPLE_ID=MMETSP0323_2 /ASSEMBLY_ACC=CAM_ASM_000346 /LENGTH=153 /DNA_ID=CAMNT_0039680785 /DNA_START=41 /DNA_END=502 /DNA_ORIENTATION=+
MTVARPPQSAPFHQVGPRKRVGSFGYLVLDGVVLEITQEMLDDHPGGPEPILSMANSDCTWEFEVAGHTESARRWALKHAVGSIDRFPKLKPREVSIQSTTIVSESTSSTSPSTVLSDDDSLAVCLTIVSLGCAALACLLWRTSMVGGKALGP